MGGWALKTSVSSVAVCALAVQWRRRGCSVEGLALDVGAGLGSRADLRRRRNELCCPDCAKVVRCWTHRRVFVRFDAIVDGLLAGLGGCCAWCRGRGCWGDSTPLIGRSQVLNNPNIQHRNNLISVPTCVGRRRSWFHAEKESPAYRLRQWVRMVEALIHSPSLDTSTTCRNNMITPQFGSSAWLARLEFAVAPILFGQGRG